MRKGFGHKLVLSILIVVCVFAAYGNINAQQKEESLKGRVDEIIENQENIMRQLDEIYTQIQLINVKI
jgi:hypothetical protein